MSTNPTAPKDDKTALVLPNQDNFEEPDEDDGKTALVQGPEFSSIEKSGSDIDTGECSEQRQLPGQFEKRKPSPPLPWPARDQQAKVDSRADASYCTETPRSTARPSNEEQTRLLGSTRLSLEDPVVGWVVVLRGPGRGRSLELGIGANSIGRDRSQKICLDFGDSEIHRHKHATLVFEPQSRRFFLQGGDMRNLTYLGDEPVMSPVELRGGETIVVGQTHLRFVPLCGPSFGWS